MDETLIDTDEIKRSVDIVSLVEADLGQPVSKSGRWLMWWCPFHHDNHPGGEPSLAVTPDTGTFYCFGCGATGDVIDWVRLRRRLSFVEACEELGGMEMTPRESVAIERRERETDPPPIEWQQRATALVEECERILWSDEGAKALTWLRGRGLTDETIRLWRLGYNPSDRKVEGMFVDRSVVIPCWIGDVLWYVKLRRPVGLPKYKNVTGGRGAMFGTDNLEGHTIAVLTEGEFDAMLLSQEAGDLVGVASLGGASKSLDERWLTRMIDKSRVFVAYDMDEAGTKGLKKLLTQSKRMIPLRPPKGNDITDYYLAGGRLRDWIEYHLGQIERELLPRQSLDDRLEVAYQQVKVGAPHEHDDVFIARFLELLAEYEIREDAA